MNDMPEAFREWVIDFGDSGYVARYPTDIKRCHDPGGKGHRKKWATEACLDSICPYFP